MKFSHDDLNDACEALNVLKGLREDYGVTVIRAETELSSGYQVTFTYNERAAEHVLSGVAE